MYRLEKDEIIAELKRMGITSSREITLCLREYVAYFHYHNNWKNRMKSIRKIVKINLGRVSGLWSYSLFL